jgi:hypothetical protein
LNLVHTAAGDLWSSETRHRPLVNYAALIDNSEQLGV